MSGLTADRQTQRKDGELYGTPVGAGVKIFAGALVALNATGYAVPGAVATTLIGLGRANQYCDNTAGVDGALRVEVQSGVFCWDSATGGDAITRANIGAPCYIVDDHTVALTNGTNTRSKAGIIDDVDNFGVWVRIGTTVN